MAAYGNVPEEDVEAVHYAVRLALKVAGIVPVVAPAEWKPIAYEMVLDALLQEWVRRGAPEPAENDAEDLTSLVRLAADVSLVQESAARECTFRTVLKNVLDDWVENWHDEEEE